MGKWHIPNELLEYDYLLLGKLAMMTETDNTYETSVNFYQTTWRNNPEVSYLHFGSRENLRSQIISTLRLWKRHVLN
jgi:hypothetical protein